MYSKVPIICTGMYGSSAVYSYVCTAELALLTVRIIGTLEYTP